MADAQVLGRADAAADVAAQNPSAILRGVEQKSITLKAFRQIPMTRRQERLRIESALPVAYFVNGDTGQKQTTKGAWTDKLLFAEELAVIVPIPINVIRDADTDLMVWLGPRCSEAMGLALDGATLFNLNKPVSYPPGLVATAIAAGNAVVLGTSTQAQGGVAQDLNVLFGKVEDEGYEVNGVAAPRAFRKVIRGARSTQGVQLGEFGANGDSIMGLPVSYGAPGLWPTGGPAGANPIALAGDYSQAIVGVRQDIEMVVLREAVIQNPDGSIAYNLAQQDMVGLRFTARYGFQTSNFVTREAGTAGQPFATLVQ
jgi:HK97 family phage major capsid protein